MDLCNATARDAIDGPEFAPAEEIVRGKHCDAEDDTICAVARIESRVNCTGAHQSRIMVACEAIDRSEVATNNDFAVGLQAKGINRPAGAGTSIKGGIERTIGVEARKIDPSG